MLIGVLAERAGTSTRTLRYYEEHGLVEARRDANGYRRYEDAELLVVHEIRALLAAGFGLDDIRPFVACLRAGNQAGHVCPDSVVVLRRKLAEVNADENPLATREFRVLSMPTLLLFQQGQVVKSIVGLRPKSFLRRELTGATQPYANQG